MNCNCPYCQDANCPNGAVVTTGGNVGLLPAPVSGAGTLATLHDLLSEAVGVIEGLAGQQAMPDDWYVPTFERLRALVAPNNELSGAAPVPGSPAPGFNVEILDDDGRWLPFDGGPYSTRESAEIAITHEMRWDRQHVGVPYEYRIVPENNEPGGQP